MFFWKCFHFPNFSLTPKYFSQFKKNSSHNKNFTKVKKQKSPHDKKFLSRPPKIFPFPKILSLSKKCPHKDRQHSISLHVISDWLSPPVLQARGGGQHPSWTRRVIHAGSESRRDPGRLRGEAVGPHAAGCRLRHARRWDMNTVLFLSSLEVSGACLQFFCYLDFLHQINVLLDKNAPKSRQNVAELNKTATMTPKVILKVLHNLY